ncbi:MAG: histidine kinase [Proteobacteria bacterium]|nr:MAG: histidine kinase [Pseudomonadota bacterium]
MLGGTELLEALPVAIYTTDAEGRITFYNEAAAEFWGWRPELGSSQWCGSWRLYWPDGRPLPHDECPMAVALKEGRPVRGLEAIAERPDGTRIRFLPFPTPLRDASGQIIGAINLLMDVSEQYEARLQSARLASIVASSDDAIISKTLDGRITCWNEGATRIFGYEASEMIGQPITKIIPRELHAEENEIVERLKQGERLDHYETVRVAKDGRRLDISITVSPLRDRFGRVVGASKIGRDITERKEAEKLQQILTNELLHRIKNTLATVQAIATQSLLHARTPAEFVPGFSGRVQAMAKANTLLTKTMMQGADIVELINDQVLLGDSDPRISCSGPPLLLGAQETLHLGLVLHELATNARKFGSLSVPRGRLSLTWQLRTNGARQLLLHWKESGGPEVNPPATAGFGSTLIEQTMRGHGGEASIQYDAKGVTCKINLPLTEKSALGIESAASARLRAPPPKPDGDRLSLTGKRVLLIEDEPLVAMDIEAILRAAGCDIIGPAGNIREAKRLIDEGDYDIALVDANLEGHPVDEIAALLSSNDCPFAFVTGYGREALPSGFRDALLVPKPFSHDQLLTTVKFLLRGGGDVVQPRPISDRMQTQSVS